MDLTLGVSNAIVPIFITGKKEPLEVGDMICDDACVYEIISYHETIEGSVYAVQRSIISTDPIRINHEHRYNDQMFSLSRFNLLIMTYYQEDNRTPFGKFINDVYNKEKGKGI